MKMWRNGSLVPPASTWNGSIAVVVAPDQSARASIVQLISVKFKESGREAHQPNHALTAYQQRRTRGAMEIRRRTHGMRRMLIAKHGFDSPKSMPPLHIGSSTPALTARSPSKPSAIVRALRFALIKPGGVQQYSNVCSWASPGWRSGTQLTDVIIAANWSLSGGTSPARQYGVATRDADKAGTDVPSATQLQLALCRSL